MSVIGESYKDSLQSALNHANFHNCNIFVKDATQCCTFDKNILTIQSFWANYAPSKKATFTFECVMHRDGGPIDRVFSINMKKSDSLRNNWYF